MGKAIPTKDTQFWIETGVHNDPSLTIVPTAISKAKPAVCTVVASTAVEGQVVWCSGTGFSELDNQYFLVGEGSTATSLILEGSDTTASNGTLGASPAVRVFVEGTDVVPLCVSQLSYDAGTVESVSVATFCDPTAVIPGLPSDGTASFAGFTSPTDKGYRELMIAARAQDTILIYIRVPPVPGNAATTTEETGTVVLEGSVNGYTESYEVGQAISWTSGLALTRASKQIWVVATDPFVAP